MSREDFFKQELGPALKSMKLECENWSASSFRVNIFAKLLQRSGTVTGFYPDLIISIFQEALDKEDVEAELKLKMFLTLSRQLQNLKDTLNSQNEFKVSKFTKKMAFSSIEMKF